MSTTATFYEIAKPMADKGVPQIRLRPNSKVALDAGWPEVATTELGKLALLSSTSPTSNSASVAKAVIGGFCFFEIDSPDVLKRIEAETGKTIPNTFRVRSRPGRGHYYFRHTLASIALGNVSQTYIKGQDFSFRADREYVVSAQSIHPTTGTPYTALDPSAPIIEIPDWLVQWIEAQKIEKKSTVQEDAPRNEAGLVPHGAIHGYLVSQAGRLRSMGLKVDDIESALLALAHEHCAPPLDDEKIKQVARSMDNYEQGKPTELALTQAQALEGEDGKLSFEEDVESLIDASGVIELPVFPEWVLVGTSIGEGLVKPAVLTSSKHPQFLFFPAMQLLMNYISGKVEIGLGKRTRFNTFVLLISPFGKFFKSSSVELAQKYFKNIGLLQSYTNNSKMTEGRVMLSQAGSAEGFCLAMDRVNCKNAIMYADELSDFVAKAGIESASLGSKLLMFYDSAETSNLVKRAKDSYTLEAGTYTFGWIACTTDRAFPRLWAQVSGAGTGISDRVLFIPSPAEPIPPKKFHDPLFVDSAKTRQLVDKAVNQKHFEYTDTDEASEQMNGMNPRSMQMVENFALAFAIDLGLSKIDNDCIERAKAVVDFTDASAEHLQLIEADNKDGRLQKEIVREIRKNGGRMSYRDLCQALDYVRHGLDNWKRCYNALKTEKLIFEFYRRSTRRPIRMVGLKLQD